MFKDVFELLFDVFNHFQLTFNDSHGSKAILNCFNVVFFLNGPNNLWLILMMIRLVVMVSYR